MFEMYQDCIVWRMKMDKIHHRVSGKLDPWQQKWYSEWFYFQDKYEPVEDKNLENYMFETIYDKEFQKKMDVWSKEEYIKFRDELIRKIFPTIYFRELVDRLSEWNLKFSIQ